MDKDEISQERQEKFWGELGVRKANTFWITPNGDVWQALPIDLNNLFKYAVPKLQDKGYWVILKAFEQSEFEGQISDIIHDPDFTIKVRDKDPATALFLVLEKVFND